jgi:tRNA A-37 threonylcarbamoyl transferase component Bud32
MRLLETTVCPQSGYVRFERVEGGMINTLYRITYIDKIFYAKIASAPAATRLRYVPYGYLPLLTPDRLSVEAQALRIMSGILPAGMVPTVIFYDKDTGLLLMSDVAGADGICLEDVFPNRINERITVTLARAVASIATAQGIPAALRGEDESRARAAKMKYGYLFPCLSLVGDNIILRAQIRQFYKTTILYANALSHGDFHTRNIIVRADDTIAVVDLEESMLHDPAYDIAVLAACYVIWSLRQQKLARACGDLLHVLLEEFRASLGLAEKDESWTNMQYRINHYIAGAVIGRATGIARWWTVDETTLGRIRTVALELLKSPRRATIAVLEEIV